MAHVLCIADTTTDIAKKMIDEFGPNRHIANLGHGVYPDTDADKVRCFVETVQDYSGKIQQS